jgi:hypothetical protein
MANLAQLALNRVQHQLPVFPGGTVREQLVNARSQVHAILLKYVPDLKFDVAEARDVMSQVNAWVERNRQDLEEAMQSSAATLPEFTESTGKPDMALNMGSSERVQQWVIAEFTIAAEGLGPWEAGKIDSLAADPYSDVSQRWAEDDAQLRLNTFGMLVKMENEGELAYIFQGPQQGVQGFGFLPVWAIIVIAIGLAAVVAYFYLESRKIELNNRLMADICKRAQDEGDSSTVAMCIKATRDLQKSTPWNQLIEQAGKVALYLGGGYLIFRYALPWALDKVAEKGSAP